MYGDRAGLVVAHLHLTCWQCGAAITSPTTCYHCGGCDCNGSSVPTESYAHESFDPDLARTLNSPA